MNQNTNLTDVLYCKHSNED